MQNPRLFMRKGTGLFLLICLCFPFFLKFGVLLHWQYHKKELTQKFCVNKMITVCQARCYRDKKIKDLDSNTDTQKEKINLYEIDAFLLPVGFIYDFFFPFSLQKSPKKASFYCFLYLQNSFKPPRC